MQDIAGVRVVFKELQQVQNFQKLMEQTYSKEDKKIKFKFKLIRQKIIYKNQKMMAIVLFIKSLNIKMLKCT